MQKPCKNCGYIENVREFKSWYADLKQSKRGRKKTPVTQPDDPTIRYIGLTQGQFAIVDATDYDWLNEFNWCAVWNRSVKSFYAHSSVTLKGVTRNMAMHRLITGVPAGVHIDHENHNTLDNRRCNIRPATKSQNACNSKMSVKNTSGYRGVSYSPREKKWRATITAGGKYYSLRFHDTAEAAARVYDEAAKRLHGKFATLNFPNEGK